MQSKKANTTPITPVTTNTNIQTKSNSQQNGSVSSSFTKRLTNSKGKGSSLSQDTNNTMSTAFGTNFNSVKVHTDHSSINMNNDLKSRAFTNGNNIYFNSGEYAPKSPKGKRLLAHELTHVIQQKGGNENVIQKQDDEDIPVSQNVLELEPLSRVPQWAHQRWEGLNSNQRSIVFLRMAGHYGMEFAGRFWQLANAGTHNYAVSYMNRTSQRRSIRFRDEIILRQGFINAGVTQERDALNRLFSSQYEVWLHPDGRMIYVMISNPSNVDTSNTQRLVPDPPDVSLPEPEMRVPERNAPSVGGGDQLELEGQTPTESDSRRRPRGPRLEGGTLRPINPEDFRLNL
ncbi:DUF4157 domain-containing protein [Kordia sp. YSTF-M3]|uniref:DUF4157 domain-containing protein n=2 Tax=Kordia aestuariivivens TaxID=2759037 RepID=A0ABR7QFW4_9FLAO|nr:DUF4157 domain-containing protein [Kordia aestuariivivens]